MGETLIAKESCNCLIPSAEADLFFRSVSARLAVEAVLSGFRALYGGLWLGGAAELTTAALSFRPNAMNLAVHKGDYSFRLPLVDIIGVGHERGFLTGIIVISTHHGRFKLRCFAARRFGDAIARTRAAALVTRSGEDGGRLTNGWSRAGS